LIHDDVTWDSSKGESSGRKKKGEEKIEDEGEKLERKVGGFGRTYSRKSQTLF